MCFLSLKFLSGTRAQRDTKSISPEEKVIPASSNLYFTNRVLSLETMTVHCLALEARNYSCISKASNTTTAVHDC